jgi:hypothetical protein
MDHEHAKVVVILVQRQPSIWVIACLKPTAYECAFAISGRGRNKDQQDLTVPVKHVQQPLSMYVTTGHQGALEFGANDFNVVRCIIIHWYLVRKSYQ